MQSSGDSPPGGADPGGTGPGALAQATPPPPPTPRMPEPPTPEPRTPTAGTPASPGACSVGSPTVSSRWPRSARRRDIRSGPPRRRGTSRPTSPSSPRPVPAAWDGFARETQQAMRVTRTANNAQVVNIPGAGGTIGLGKFSTMDGRADTILATGTAMVGGIALNDSPSASTTRPCSPASPRTTTSSSPPPTPRTTRSRTS